MGFKFCQIFINISFVNKHLDNKHRLGINHLINDLKGFLILKISDFF